MHSDPVQKEYSRLAEKYDRRWSFYIDATIQQTLNRLEFSSGERILDLGCGTGSLIQRLLQIASGSEIVGIDPCAEMLEIARQKMPQSVELKVGLADDIPFPNDYFDIVVSTSAFHYFRDPFKALQEAKRVLKTNGRIVITDWCHDYLTCQICDFFLKRFNHAHFRTYKVADCRAMMQDEGLQKITIERYKIDWLWGMMTAKAVKEINAE